MHLHGPRAALSRAPGARRLLAAVGVACAVLPAVGGATRARADERLDRRIAEIDGLVADAHFHTALGLVEAAREQAERLGPAAAPAARARLEVLAATAEIALGHRRSAARSMRRALRADPNLQLAEAEASPKLLELWRAARPAVTAP